MAKTIYFKEKFNKVTLTKNVIVEKTAKKASNYKRELAIITFNPI